MKFGKTVISVGRYSDGRDWIDHTIDHTLDGKRAVITRRHLEGIKLEAKKLAERLTSEPVGDVGMTPWEREDYEKAKRAVTDFGVSLQAASAE